MDFRGKQLLDKEGVSSLSIRASKITTLLQCWRAASITLREKRSEAITNYYPLTIWPTELATRAVAYIAL